MNELEVMADLMLAFHVSDPQLRCKTRKEMGKGLSIRAPCNQVIVLSQDEHNAPDDKDKEPETDSNRGSSIQIEHIVEADGKRKLKRSVEIQNSSNTVKTAQEQEFICLD